MLLNFTIQSEPCIQHWLEHLSSVARKGSKKRTIVGRFKFTLYQTKSLKLCFEHSNCGVSSDSPSP